MWQAVEREARVFGVLISPLAGPLQPALELEQELGQEQAQAPTEEALQLPRRRQDHRRTETTRWPQFPV